MNTLLEQLDALAPLAAAATEGPWVPRPSQWQSGCTKEMFFVLGGLQWPNEGCIISRDAAFIAAARNFLTPANIAALRVAPAAAGTGWVSVKERLPEPWQEVWVNPFPEHQFYFGNCTRARYRPADLDLDRPAEFHRDDKASMPVAHAAYWHPYIAPPTPPLTQPE